MMISRNVSLPDIKAAIQESSFLNTTDACTSQKSSAKRQLVLQDPEDNRFPSPYYFTTNTPQNQHGIPSMQNTRDFLSRKKSQPYNNINLNHQQPKLAQQYLTSPKNTLNKGRDGMLQRVSDSPQLIFQPNSAVKFKRVPAKESRLQSRQQLIQTPSKRYETQKLTYENTLNFNEFDEDQEEPSIFKSRKNLLLIRNSEPFSQKRNSTPGYIGVESMQFFYQKFKRLDKELQRPEHQSSATTSYLKEVRRYNLLPQPLGLISHQGNKGQIKGSNMKLGHKYGLALSKSMKNLSDTHSIELQDNRLGKIGGEAILSNLQPNLRILNLDDNLIGSKGLLQLVKWIDNMNRQCQLEELSLVNNLIDDTFCTLLSESLVKSLPPLRDMNLSRNKIGDKGAQSLAEFLHNQYQLKTLKINWSQIQGKGAIALAHALKDCQKLTVFDASFNMFGNRRDGEFAKALGEAVNKGFLRHLDISYNSLDQNECEIFGKAICDNHTLWGLHMLGNACIVDSMGFVRPGHKLKVQTRDILHSPVRDGQNITVLKNNPKYAKAVSYQKCWICEGWSERKFEWKICESGIHIKEPAYIHFDFDEYQPWLLNKNEEEGYYFIWKMVPPGQSNYFYSFGGENGEAEIAKDQSHHRLPAPKHIIDVEFNEYDGKTNQRVNFKCNFTLKSLNYVQAVQQTILDENYEPIQFQAIVPRLSDPNYVRPYHIRPRTPWTRPMSLFRDFQIETEEILDECFENDWNAMKIPKMTEEEKIEVKVEMRKHYRLIKDTYRYLASIGSSGQVFSILLNCYTDFVRQTGILDGKTITLVMSDTEFYSINKRTKASAVNPDGLAQSKVESLQMMIEKNILPKYGYLDAQRWRDERYWNEEIDNLYKSHFPIFEILFKTFGCHYLKPSEKPFMMVDEFENLAYQAGFIKDNFGTRECAACFSLSIQTSTDELNSDRHLKAHFSEFLEAFARVCERLSVPAPYDIEAGEMAMTEEERTNQPLNQKIINVLPSVVKNCMTEKFVEKWKWPKREIDTGLFRDIYFRRNKKDPDSLAEFGITPIKDVPKTIFEL